METSRHFTEVRLATLGVSELDAAIEFYDRAFGFGCLQRGRVPEALAETWRFDPDNPLEFAIVAPGADARGGLRLLAARKPGKRLWTQANRLTAAGCYALNFRCRDIHEQLARIRAAGGEAGTQPHFWEVSDEVHVYDSMSCDPDGTCLDLFSYARGGDLRGPLDTDVSIIQTVALAVADVGRSRAFYNALGFVELFDRVLDFDGLQDMLGMDQPVKIHNANLIKDGDIVPGRVEMFAYLETGLPAPEPLADAATPPNLGILSFSMVVDDLDSALAAIVDLGAREIARSGSLELPGFGRARLATVAGPDGEAIELVEEQSS